MLDVQARLNALFAKLQHEMDEAELERIRENPDAHKLTLLMEPGKPATYYYFVKSKRRGREVRFCYSKHRNAAGYYLRWREIETRDKLIRDDFGALKTKRSALNSARRAAGKDPV